MAKNDGGPAFACAAENGHQAGMSIRDYFAAQAMTGWITSLGRSTRPPQDVKAAAWAYEMADAMIAE